MGVTVIYHPVYTVIFFIFGTLNTIFFIDAQSESGFIYIFHEKFIRIGKVSARLAVDSYIKSTVGVNTTAATANKTACIFIITVYSTA